MISTIRKRNVEMPKISTPDESGSGSGSLFDLKEVKNKSVQSESSDPDNPLQEALKPIGKQWILYINNKAYEW